MSTPRDATTADLPRLVELGRAMHAESPRFSKLRFSAPKLAEQLCGLIISPDGFLQVVERDGAIVGGLAGAISEHWCSPDKVAFDMALFINPDRRGGMAAAKLVDAFKTWAAENGAVHITLGISTGVMVEETARLYRAIGLKQFGYLFEV